MSFLIKLHYHPKKEEGVGYDAERKEVLERKIGEPFEDTGLEKLAAVVMGQMARRDILIFDVEIEEYVRRPVSFKESKDGKGIVLKGKKFSLDDTARLVAEDVYEAPKTEVAPPVSGNQMAVAEVQPHNQQGNLDSLYAQPNRSLPVQRTNIQPTTPVNTKRVLYWVYFDPDPYRPEAKSLGLKFNEEKKYPVHQIVPHQSGRLDAQQLIITDESGRQVKVDEKFFTSAGQGLYADKQLGFSKPRETKRNKLMYDDELSLPVADIPPEYANIPVDDGKVPQDLQRMPDLRPNFRP